MDNFTPYTALAGGMLIGLSATIMLLFTGRITGISGMVSNLIPPLSKGEWQWRLTFLIGMIAASWLYLSLSSDVYHPRIQFSPILLIIGGFLVGFGARLGNGCTSSHAICGIARLSPRSIISTLVFMGTAATTVFIIRHLLGDIL